MNEQQTMLSATVDGLFASLGPDTPLPEAWAQVEELGLESLLVAEAAGGFGGNWDDARLVFRLAGYHALGAPVVEAILARRIVGADAPEGRGTLAGACAGTLADGRFTGTVRGVVHGVGAAFVVAPAPGGDAMLLCAGDGTGEEQAAPDGVARAVLRFDGVPAVRLAGDVTRLGAFARTAQIAGALDAALALSVGYVNDRKQFGRPLAKFQAVQHNLATFAGEAAAANCAAVGAAQALDRGDGAFEVAAAKLRANQAAGTGAAIAHQVHGAIGFTREYDLHPLTRRLWTWRSEFGGDSHWAGEIGARVAEAGPDRFWTDLTALTD